MPSQATSPEADLLTAYERDTGPSQTHSYAAWWGVTITSWSVRIPISSLALPRKTIPLFLWLWVLPHVKVSLLPFSYLLVVVTAVPSTPRPKTDGLLPERVAEKLRQRSGDTVKSTVLCTSKGRTADPSRVPCRPSISGLRIMSSPPCPFHQNDGCVDREYSGQHLVITLIVFCSCHFY